MSISVCGKGYASLHIEEALSKLTIYSFSLSHFFVKAFFCANGAFTPHFHLVSVIPPYVYQLNVNLRDARGTKGSDTHIFLINMQNKYHKRIFLCSLKHHLLVCQLCKDPTNARHHAVVQNTESLPGGNRFRQYCVSSFCKA